MVNNVIEYRNLVEKSSTAIIVVEKKERKVLMANKEWRKIEGIPDDKDVEGKSLYEIMPEQQFFLTDEQVECLTEDACTEFHKGTRIGIQVSFMARSMEWNGIDAYVCYINDQTEIWESHRRLQDIIDLVPGGIGIYEIRQGIPYLIYINDAYYRMLGFEPGERKKYLGVENVKAVYPKDLPEIMSGIDKMEKGSDSMDVSYRTKNKDGKLFWVRMVCSVVERMEGVLTVYCSFLDNNEQKTKERRYEEQVSMKRVLASSETAVAMLNLTQNTVSETYTRDAAFAECLIEKNVDAVISTVAQRYIPKCEKEAYEDVFKRTRMLSAYEQGTIRNSFRHHKQESDNCYESSYDIIKNPYTGDIEAIAVLRDITEMVRTEQVVDTLMRIDYESIMTIDAEDRYAKSFIKSDIDKVFDEQKIVGDSKKGLESFIRRYCVDEDVERVVKETSLPYVNERLKKVPVYITLFAVKSGNEILRKRVMYTYLNNDENTILCAVQDVTETYRQEEEQQQKLIGALRAAEQASKAKNDFFSRMSHDLRTPMNGILGLAELSEGEANLRTMKHNVRKIKESGEYLLNLINDTLDFQRIESGKMTLEPEIVDTRVLLESIVDIIKVAAQEKKINFIVRNINADLNWFLKVDPVRIKQLLFNLLSNAVKFTPKGGEVVLEFECIARQNMISHMVIRVSDTGIGMSEDFLEKGIFKPFSQEYNKATTQYEGSGLGLSIVHKIVELMDGSIDVKSKQGEGTTFILKLDLERVDKGDVMSETQVDRWHLLGVTDVLVGKRILMVEDHFLNAEIAKRLLEKVRCNVTWAKNGREGVTIFEKSPDEYFDAILMDIRMPELNGLEATEKIRRLDRPDAATIPIIAMTANAYEEDVKMSKAAGMNAHLAKPIEPVKLYETLAHYVMQN